MRYTRVLLTASTVALAACTQRQVEVDTGDVILDSRWVATLAPVSAARDSAAITGATTVTLGGRGSMMRGSNSVETRAMLASRFLSRSMTRIALAKTGSNRVRSLRTSSISCA